MKTDIKRAIVVGNNSDDTARPVQNIKCFESNSEAEIIFGYGHHANLPEDSLLVVLPVLNQNSNTVAFGGLPNERIQVEQGEVVFYHPITKSKIHFKNNGDIDIDSLESDLNLSVNNGTITASGNVTINVAGDATLAVDGELNVTAPTTNWTGDITMTGDINQTGTLTNDETTSNGIVLSTHTHDYIDNIGDPTVPTASITDGPN